MRSYALLLSFTLLASSPLAPALSAPELTPPPKPTLAQALRYAVEKKLAEQWAEAHPGALAALLKQMRQSMPSQTAVLPIYMEQSAVRTRWMTSWDDPKALPPPLRPSLESDTYQAPKAIAAAARTQGKSVLLYEGIENDGDTDTLARSLKADLGDGKWDGYVLGFKCEEVTQGKDPLDSLVRAVNLSLQKHAGITDTKQ